MIRAYVSENVASFNVTVALVNHPGEDGLTPPMLMRLGEHGHSAGWEVIEPGAVMRPTLTLTDHEARAVLDGLIRHFRGAEDARALRRDYDDERKRVDGLLATVSGLATVLAGQEVAS
jgi:hypothetical protein